MRQTPHTVHVPVTPPTASPHVGLAGPRAVRVEVAGVHQALELAAWARSEALEADEVVPGAGTVVFEGVRDPAALVDRLRRWTPGSAQPADLPLVEVPVTYDGADLADVARRWGTDADGVAERLGDTELVSAFCGFAPGFAYLSGLAGELAVPRLDSPRPVVPAGSVAVADRWCGIYPSASPGGWRLVGRTDAALWDAAREHPALLAPGTRVRLVRA